MNMKLTWIRRITAACLILLMLAGVLSNIVEGETGAPSGGKDYRFLYKKEHVRDKDMEELSRKLACFWVSREVKFEDYDNVEEKLVLKMTEKELEKLNCKFLYINGKMGKDFTQGYKLQFKREIVAGVANRDYMTAGSLCIAYREGEERRNTFVIAIRGSQGNADWMTNLNLEPEIIGLPALQRLRDLNDSINTGDKDYHIGFYKSMELMEEELLKLTFEKKNGERSSLKEIIENKNEKNSFLICGYSKGAALSELLTMKLAVSELYRKNGDEMRNGISSYNFAGPNVYNGENKKSIAGKNRKRTEALCKEISLFNFNIDGDAVNMAEQIYKRKYGESYLIESTLPYPMKTLRMIEIHEEWYRALLEHLKNGDLGKYKPVG